MKKTLFYLVSALFMSSFSSCSQDSDPYVDPAPSVKMQEVTINIAGVENQFESETSPGMRSASIKDANIKYLNYQVWADNGMEKKWIKSRVLSKDQVTSVIKDTLAVGKYRIVIFASNAEDFDKKIYSHSYKY